VVNGRRKKRQDQGDQLNHQFSLAGPDLVLRACAAVRKRCGTPEVTGFCFTKISLWNVFSFPFRRRQPTFDTGFLSSCHLTAHARNEQTDTHAYKKSRHE